MISILKDDSILVDSGPLTMTVQAYKEGKPFRDAALRGAREALEQFAELARIKEEAKKNIQHYGELGGYPAVLRRMIQACRRSGDPTLTPMAAVAGTLSDIAAEAALQAGAEKVLANNGGDISIRLSPDQEIRVGLRSDIRRREPDYVIFIPRGLKVGGVATSGLGGRSFTKGIASAVTILAEDASFADACATVVANSTYFPSPKVHRILAEERDPDTDIRGHWVTERVDALSPEEIQGALARGAARAAGLDVLGAVIVVQEQLRIVPKEWAERVRKIQRQAGE